MSQTAKRPDSEYRPQDLLDTLLAHLKLKNDAALSRSLHVGPSIISKIRHHKMPLSGDLLLRMHVVTDLSIKELRAIMGDRNISEFYRPYTVRDGKADSRVAPYITVDRLNK